MLNKWWNLLLSLVLFKATTVRIFIIGGSIITAYRWCIFVKC